MARTGIAHAFRMLTPHYWRSSPQRASGASPPSRRGFGRAAVVLVSILGALTALGLTSPVARAQTQETIYNRNSVLCLDNPYSGNSYGRQLWQYDCNGTAAQAWYIEPAAQDPNGVQLFQVYVVAYPGVLMCMDLYQNALVDYQPIVRWGCNASDPAQLWYIGSQLGCYNPHAFFPSAIYGSGTSYQVEVYHAQTNATAPVDLYQSNGTATQDWLFNPNNCISS